MPSKESTEKRSARKAYLLELDNAVANASVQMQQRIRKPSSLAASLGRIGCYGWRGYNFDEYGQGIALKKMGSANRDRHNETCANIKALAEKYRPIWQSRGAAGIIARLEGISPDTVRRYKRLHPYIE